MNKKVALDTNILLFLHNNFDLEKQALVEDLFSESPHISSQVISEYLNTTRRILNLSKEDLLIQASGLFSGCKIMTVVASTLLLAGSFVRKYQFQLFDAVVVAAAAMGSGVIFFCF